MIHNLSKKYLDILELAKNGKIPTDLPSEEREKIDILRNLINDEYLTGKIKQVYSYVVINNLRITIKGENALVMTEAKHTLNTIEKKISNKSNNWHNKPLGKITIGVIIGVIVIIIGIVINHYIKLVKS